MRNGVPGTPQIDSRRHGVVIFDMDGVVTDTASMHAARPWIAITSQRTA
ncbi:hypothetical protein ACWEKR_33195 [Nocardia sp. NPDC004573]